MKIILSCFLFISLFAKGQQDQFDSLFTGVKDSMAIGFSGVVMIAENGKPVYHKAFGYREFENQIPLQASDIFELASVSKQFTAMIIMMLKEKAKLNYDDSVSKYLEIPYKGITIRHLLTHTSGLPDYQDIMDKYWDKNKVAGNPDCIEYLNKYAPPKRFEPGEKYEYSNTGYLLLASIAEIAGGKDFIELCRKWIFKKLKMTSTDIRTLDEKKATKNFAIGHIYVQERNKWVRADSFPSSNYTIWLGNRKGPGRISSTASDLLKWDQALYTDKLIRQSTLQEAFTPMKLNDGSLSDYGFGWSLRTDTAFGKIVSHTGDNPGYKTQIIRYVDKRKTIIVLNNNAHRNFSAIIKQLEARLSD
ncbi:MAG TPA: serine hydrolase domain-containing protein [Chitinophagaceae bacterium]|nr:serine hydrolase domain-containing protein [Chitinophagaceae bacterium]